MTPPATVCSSCEGIDPASCLICGNIQPADPLDAIQARADAATPGPWRISDDDTTWRLHGTHTRIPGMKWQILKAPKTGTPYAEYWPNQADGEFIAAARTDVPALLTEVRRLRAAMAEALAVLNDGPQWVNDRVQQHWSVPARNAAEILGAALADDSESLDSRSEPCGEGHCICYGIGPDHAECACGCDCPRDIDGQLIDD